MIKLQYSTIILKGTSGKPHFLPLLGYITSGVGVGSGPGLVHINRHCCMYQHTEFRPWGLSPSKKGGLAVFENENFYYFSSLGNKNWILFEPDFKIELNLDLFVCSFYWLV